MWTILPPVIAIVLAIATRRIYLSLVIGIAVGAAMLSGWQPVAATTLFFEGLLWPAIAHDDHLRVYAFTLLMGAMVGVIRANGGMQGAVAAMSRFATTRRRAGLLTWLLGMVIFFDDYANTLLLGTSMRPLTDRLRISREKLAYIVDSTAAPVAGLALVSTWIAGELGFISDGLKDLEFTGGTPDAFSLFVASIPYRFYVLWALLLVPLTILLTREFGPMAAAEKRVLSRKEPVDDDGSEERSAESRSVNERQQRHWSYAAVPVLVVICVTTTLLWTTGTQKLAAMTEKAKEAALVHPDSAEAIPPDVTVMTIFGEASSYLSLVYGSLAGLAVAIGMSLAIGGVRADTIRSASLDGARFMFPALAILTLAWSLSELTKMMGTGDYLGGLVQQAISPEWLPTIVFILSSAVAFCTGTSWGTMGILMPLAIGATHASLADGAAIDPYQPVFIGTIGSVLSGAIFGDHCSPISDTTVLSSQASGCDHIAHVSTQLPYALVVGAAAILFGTIPIGFGVPVWVMLPLGMLAVAAAFWFGGSVVKEEQLK